MQIQTQHIVENKKERRCSMGYNANRDYSVNQRIREIIENEDKRPSAIADKANIRRDTFSRILRCQRPLYANEIMPICKAIGIGVDELFGTEKIRQ
jgi:hypothetical protein